MRTTQIPRTSSIAGCKFESRCSCRYLESFGQNGGVTRVVGLSAHYRPKKVRSSPRLASPTARMLARDITPGERVGKATLLTYVAAAAPDGGLARSGSPGVKDEGIDATLHARQYADAIRGAGVAASHIPFVRWSGDEDRLLFDAVKRFGTHAWIRVSLDVFSGRRSALECQQRWNEVTCALSPSVLLRFADAGRISVHAVAWQGHGQGLVVP